MFTIFNATGFADTIVATEAFAWAVAIATNAKGVEYPTGKFHRKVPQSLASLASRMALSIICSDAAKRNALGYPNAYVASVIFGRTAMSRG